MGGLFFLCFQTEGGGLKREGGLLWKLQLNFHINNPKIHLFYWAITLNQAIK